MERDRKNDHERKGARPFLSCLTIHPLSPCENGRSLHVLVKRIGCLQHRLKKPGDSPRVDAELREILDDAFEIFGLYRFHRQW